MSAALVVKPAIALLTDKKTRKAVGVVIGMICVPFILIICAVLSMASAAAEHNRSTIIASFDRSVVLPASLPDEYIAHIAALRTCMVAIDNAVATLEIPEDAPALDTTLIKAIFYGLHYGEDQPVLSDDAAKSFVECFVTYEERTRPIDPNTEEEANSDLDDTDEDEDDEGDAEDKAGPEQETYIVAIPITDIPTMFSNVSQHIGQSLDNETQSVCMEIYYIVKYGEYSRANQTDALRDALMDSDSEYIGGAVGSPFTFDWHSNVTSEFGMRKDPITGKLDGHTGLDIAAPYGTPIRAVAAGKVILARYGHDSYGNYIVIDHGGGVSTLYAHCSILTATVGQVVSAGDEIAKVGSTGRATGNHLHIEVCVNGERKDPRTFL